VKVIKIERCHVCPNAIDWTHIRHLHSGSGFLCPHILDETGYPVEVDPTKIHKKCPLDNAEPPNTHCFYYGGRGCSNINLDVIAESEI